MYDLSHAVLRNVLKLVVHISVPLNFEEANVDTILIFPIVFMLIYVHNTFLEDAASNVR